MWSSENVLLHRRPDSTLGGFGLGGLGWDDLKRRLAGWIPEPAAFLFPPGYPDQRGVRKAVAARRADMATVGNKHGCTIWRSIRCA